MSLISGHTGVCGALSASWINYHAHNDCLANHLQPDENGALDALTLQSVLHLQHSFVNSGNEFSAVETWLEMHGMVSLKMNIKSSVDKDTEFHIITSLGKNFNCYAYVIFCRSRRGANHAVAIWIGGSNYINGDICFFDPNYGEAWFVITFALSNRAL